MPHKAIEFLTERQTNVRITRTNWGTFLISVKKGGDDIPVIYEEEVARRYLEDFSVWLQDLMTGAADEYVPEEDV